MLYDYSELCPHFSNFSDAQLCTAQGHLSDCRGYTAASEQRVAWLLGSCPLAAATSCESLCLNTGVRESPGAGSSRGIDWLK
jgi:hypothetical protein